MLLVNDFGFYPELDDFLQELDEDVEGMQSTILFLQQELKLAKDTITTLERENSVLKNGSAYDNVAVKKHYKDAGGGGGNNIDAKITENSTENYLINGSRLSTASSADLMPHPSIHSENLNNHATGSSTTTTVDTTNTATNLNSYSAASNCERASKTNLNNNCPAKNSLSSAASHIVLVETRTLRSSGRNINSVVDELRISKLKAQFNNANGNSCDSGVVDASSGIVVSEPSNFNEARKNGSGIMFGTSNSSGSAQTLRKAPYKRGYNDVDDDTSSGDDDDDDNSHSNSKLNNNNNSNKNSCKENNGSSGIATVVDNASDCLSSVVAIKKTRRSSVLSLDLNEEDSRIELKVDERPLNLVTSASGGASESQQSDSLTAPQNGII